MEAYILRPQFDPVIVNDDDILSQADAARLLNITPEGVRSAMNRGALPTIMLKPGFGQRYTLRSAVQSFTVKR